MASRSQNPSSVSLPALRRQTSAVRAACRKTARADLCGGRWATGVPTATRSSDRRDVWVGPKPTERYRRAVVIDAGPKNTTNEDTLQSERRSALKKTLTEPTLLEMSGGCVTYVFGPDL